MQPGKNEGETRSSRWRPSGFASAARLQGVWCHWTSAACGQQNANQRPRTPEELYLNPASLSTLQRGKPHRGRESRWSSNGGRREAATAGGEKRRRRRHPRHGCRGEKSRRGHGCQPAAGTDAGGRRRGGQSEERERRQDAEANERSDAAWMPRNTGGAMDGAAPFRIPRLALHRQHQRRMCVAVELR